MARVQEFDRAMFENYLKSKELKYLVDQEGDYQVQFSHDNDWGCGLTVWLIASGKGKDICTVRVHADKPVPRAQFSRAILLCNEWNATRRWPKTFVHYNPDDNNEPCQIICEDQLDVQKGLHQELLDDLATTTIRTSMSFWEWANKEQDIWAE